MSQCRKISQYNANLVKASLKVAESRVIAGLLLNGADAESWHKSIAVDNVLQKRSPLTAATFANYIAHRLRTLEPEAWQLIYDSSNEVATQLVLAASLRHSELLADFLNLIVKDRRRRFQVSITNRDWTEFIEGCKGRDPTVETWTDAVVDKLRQNSFRILAEAGYVTSTKTMTLQNMTVAPQVVELLNRLGHAEILRTMHASE